MQSCQTGKIIREGEVGVWRRVIEPNTDPYSFFTETVMNDGRPDTEYIFIWDELNDDSYWKGNKFFQKWGRPTEKFKAIMKEVGVEGPSVRIILDKNDRNNVLMVLSDRNHIFTWWMCCRVTEMD